MMQISFSAVLPATRWLGNGFSAAALQAGAPGGYRPEFGGGGGGFGRGGGGGDQ